MKRRIKRIAPLQAGKMLGIFYAGISLLLVPFVLLAGLLGAFAQHANNQSSGNAPAALFAGFSLVFVILIPVIYGVMGFVFGIISAAVYNLVAGFVGGFEVEIEECP
jgi:Transmembrane domain of unknown function (DUF3566)